jgi:alkaline phosphatase D
MNDAGSEFPRKRESQEVFLDFYRVEQSSPRRQREGVYHSDVLGDEGSGRLQLILLDTRYFRSPLVKVSDAERAANRGPYGPNRDPEATVLGEAQWAWLGEQLRRPAELRLVATSIQAIPEDHGWEKWANFPQERARLLRLVRESRAGGVVLLSGDRHLAEVSVLPADAPGVGVGYPLYEVTSSGLTQSGGGSDDEPNRWRLPDTKPFRAANFGLVEVDWPGRRVRLEVRDAGGHPEVGLDVPLDSLAAPGH